jgi:glycine/D-amino acid oxidase-like deaminating enzyme
MTETFDVIIVGAGQAGPPLAGCLTAQGQKVAVIERQLFGGTCVNFGCIPTKTMIASAHAAHVARRGAEYGIRTGDITVDMAAVKSRKDAIMRGDCHRAMTVNHTSAATNTSVKRRVRTARRRWWSMSSRIRIPRFGERRADLVLRLTAGPSRRWVDAVQVAETSGGRRLGHAEGIS